MDRIARNREGFMSATSAPPQPNAVVLHGTDWETYTRLLKVFAERPAVR
jgi:hypothetical protein